MNPVYLDINESYEVHTMKIGGYMEEHLVKQPTSRAAPGKSLLQSFDQINRDYGPPQSSPMRYISSKRKQIVYESYGENCSPHE
jgi:hypothetical protein